MSLTNDQESALKAVRAWLRNPTKQVFRLFGYAGTGKTFTTQRIVEEVEGDIVYMAYTGKAASVMRRNGMPTASTLHSNVYRVQVPQAEIDRLMYRLSRMEPNDPEARMLKVRIKELSKPRFMLNDESPLLDASLIVLDECSMVNAENGGDLLSFGKPVLVLGDPMQLPPIQGAGFFVGDGVRPDAMLTQIVRQAADNPVIRASMMAREGQNLPMGAMDDGRFTRLRKTQVNASQLASLAGPFPSDRHDIQFLTGKNVSRRGLNTLIRTSRGIDGPYPEKDEVLVVLRNDRDLGVLNGMQVHSRGKASLNPDEKSLDFEFEERDRPGEEPRIHVGVDVDARYFQMYDNPKIEEEVEDRSLLQMDYGYAMTVHKAQGSQWDHVVICDDGFLTWKPQERRRWLYTAITRAASRVTLVG